MCTESPNGHEGKRTRRRETAKEGERETLFANEIQLLMNKKHLMVLG